MNRARPDQASHVPPGQRPMVRVTSCPVCGGADRQILFDTVDAEYGLPGRFTIGRCGSCGLAYLIEMPAPGDLGAYYTKEYAAYRATDSDRWGPLFRFTSAFRFQGQEVWFDVPLETPPREAARLLDVGVGSGAIAARSRALGWSVIGLDAVQAALAVSRAGGIDCVRADAGSPPFRGATFHRIVLSHVLEHCQSPVDLLRKCREILVPGGTMVVAVPNFDSLARRLFGPRWFAGLSLPRHLLHFNRSSLAFGLRASGFSRFDIISTPFPSFGGSLLGAMGADHATITRSSGGRAAAMAGFPLDLASSLVGAGHALVAVCQR